MRYLISVAVIAALMAACGGGEPVADTEPDEPTLTAGASVVTTTTMLGGSDADQPDTSDIAGVGEGTVTIDGDTYTFGDAGFPALRCEPDMFGVFFVFLQQVDDSGAEVAGGSLELTLLLEGTDPEIVGQDNEGRLKIGEQEWIADPEDIAERGLEAGTSQVDSYTIDGNSVTGTATFYEEESYFATTGGSDDPIVTTQGAFDVTCSGE